jgi:hypothetical protein
VTYKASQISVLLLPHSGLILTPTYQPSDLTSAFSFQATVGSSLVFSYSRHILASGCLHLLFLLLGPLLPDIFIHSLSKLLKNATHSCLLILISKHSLFPLNTVFVSIALITIAILISYLCIFCLLLAAYKLLEGRTLYLFILLSSISWVLNR